MSSSRFGVFLSLLLVVSFRIKETSGSQDPNRVIECYKLADLYHRPLMLNNQKQVVTADYAGIKHDFCMQWGNIASYNSTPEGCCDSKTTDHWFVHSVWLNSSPQSQALYYLSSSEDKLTAQLVNRNGVLGSDGLFVKEIHSLTNQTFRLKKWVFRPTRPQSSYVVMENGTTKIAAIHPGFDGQTHGLVLQNPSFDFRLQETDDASG